MLHQSAILANRAPSNADNAVALNSISHQRRFGREQEIYHQGDRRAGWYRIASGAARQYLLRADGRRQIVDIHLPGDFFGFAGDGRHHFGEQALVEGTSVCFYPRHRIEELIEKNPEVAREIRMRSFETIGRLREQMLVLGAITARRKVHAFLTYICHRLSPGDAGGATLPISRYDIADLLGISAETVCRAFTELQQSAVIRLDGPRQVLLIKPAVDSDLLPIERMSDPERSQDRQARTGGPLQLTARDRGGAAYAPGAPRQSEH
jgi:CRP/FNR family transcriptional regulator, nitrogen fixation regulation protein